MANSNLIEARQAGQRPSPPNEPSTNATEEVAARLHAGRHPEGVDVSSVGRSGAGRFIIAASTPELPTSKALLHLFVGLHVAVWTGDTRDTRPISDIALEMKEAAN
jgi:hypothetical protein